MLIRFAMQTADTNGMMRRKCPPTKRLRFRTEIFHEELYMCPFILFLISVY
jgi:hypothetical protein